MNAEAKIVNMLEELLNRHLWMIKEALLKKLIGDFKSELTLILKPIESSETTSTQIFDRNISQESISSDVSLLQINKQSVVDFSSAERESSILALKTPVSRMNDLFQKADQQSVAIRTNKNVPTAETPNVPLTNDKEEHIFSPPAKKSKVLCTEIKGDSWYSQ